MISKSSWTAGRRGGGGVAPGPQREEPCVSVPADGEEEAVGRRMMTPRGGDGEGQDVAMAEG